MDSATTESGFRLSVLSIAKPRVVFLNRCYWPDSEATGQLLEDLCRHLAESYDVHVLCGQPNSPAPGVDYSTSGVQNRQGITIHRVKHTRFAKRIPAGRILNLLSFSRAASRYLRRVSLRPDVVVSETDPFLLPIVASQCAARSGAKLVSYLQDIYPDVAEAIGKAQEGFITRQIRTRLRRAYQASQRVVVLGSCMKERLTAMPWGIDPEIINIIPNWADSEKIHPIDSENNPFRSSNGLADRFIVMHSGNMGLTQRLDVLIEAAMSPQWPQRAVLMLVGEGAAKQQLLDQVELIRRRTSAEKELPDIDDRIRFMTYQPREKLCESLSAGDLHVVSMHQNITGCLCPSKLYGILAAGRPVLAIADQRTDLCRTVASESLGWTCKPGDVQGIVRCVSEACARAEECERIGRHAREIAIMKYDRQVVIKQFKEMLDDVCEQPAIVKGGGDPSTDHENACKKPSGQKSVTGT